MNKWLVLLIGLNLIMIESNSHARGPRPSPIVASEINSRFYDAIVEGKVISAEIRTVTRTQEEVDEAKQGWERISSYLKYREELYSRPMSPQVNHANIIDRRRSQYLSDSLQVVRLTIELRHVLKGGLNTGDVIYVEWPLDALKALADYSYSQIRDISVGRHSIMFLMNPSAGLEYHPVTHEIGRRGLSKGVADERVERLKDLIGEYIANMDFLISKIGELSPRGERMLRELVVGEIKDRETLIAEWRKERARFKEWKEYELTDAVKKRLIVDKPADEEMRD